MPGKLKGESARAFAASIDDFVADQTSQMDAVKPPAVSKGAENLKGVQRRKSNPGFKPKSSAHQGQVLAHSAAMLLPSAWAYQKRMLKGEKLTFRPKVITDRNLVRLRPFLEQPLNDDAKEKGYRKARQIGLSENSVTEAFWFLDVHKHTKVFYTFPTGRQMQDFSNTRIAEAITESPYLSSIMGDIKNVNLKKIGTSFLFLRGAQTERLGEGVDADVAYFDEIDRMPPRVKVAFEESLQGSHYGWVREISTPTVPNYGIDMSWLKSKQHFWFITCSHCSKKQTLEWIPNDDFGGRVSVAERDGIHVYVCRHCEKELAAEDRWSGEWVSKYPRRDKSFYQFSQLMAPWITAQKLWEKQEDYPFKQLFYNYCLGVPYLGDNILVTEEDIYASQSHQSREDWSGPLVLGTDWGDKSWIVVLQQLPGGKIGLVHLERILSPEISDIIQQHSGVMRRFNIKVAVNDAGYGKDRNSILLKLFPEKVFSCFYPNSDKSSRIFEPQWQDESHKVSIDRTTSIKLSLGMFKGGKSGQVVIAREVDKEDLRIFVNQLTNLVSVKDFDEKTGEIHEWIASTGQDHFGHAFTYACTALAKLGQLPKSECWDWNKDLLKARRRGLIKDTTAGSSLPQVPGMMPTDDYIQLSGGMGNMRADKALCYGVSHDPDNDICKNCMMQNSCKNISATVGGIDL